MSHGSERAGWMSPQLAEAWYFRAETTPPATTPPGQAPASGQPPAGTSGTTSPADGGEQSGTRLSPAELEAELARVRREAAGHRAENTRLRSLQEAADAAKLSDLEKAQKRVTDLEAENARIKADAQAALTTSRIERIAAQLGIVDPEVAAALIPPGDVDRDAAGNPTNLEALLKKLLAAKPYLAPQQSAQPPQAGAAATNPASGRGTPPLTVADVKKMTRQQIAARYPEVKAALQRGV